jgi:hypothetical protein
MTNAFAATIVYTQTIGRDLLSIERADERFNVRVYENSEGRGTVVGTAEDMKGALAFFSLHKPTRAKKARG